MRYLIIVVFAWASIASAQLPADGRTFYATFATEVNAPSPPVECLGFQNDPKFPLIRLAANKPGRYCGFTPEEQWNARWLLWKFVSLGGDQYMIVHEAAGGTDTRCVVGDAQAGSPYRHAWGSGPFCGFPGGKDKLLQDGRAVWRITHLEGDLYQVTNQAADKCLVNQRGTLAGVPPVFQRWAPGAYCGIEGGRDALLRNRTAVWRIETLDYPWRLAAVTNGTSGMMTLNLPVEVGKTAVINALAMTGDAALTIPTHGAIVFDDQGYETTCPTAYRRVLITYHERRWTFFYRPGAELNVTIAADGEPSFAVAPERGKVVAGNVTGCS